MQQIGDWLNELGLGQYTRIFFESGVDLTVLPQLTDQDLEKLGVLLGHRRKILSAIHRKDGATSVDNGQRRQLTVMFCDLAGSTDLSNGMDPEDLRDLIRRYRETCSRTIRHHGGTISRFVG